MKRCSLIIGLVVVGCSFFSCKSTKKATEKSSKKEFTHFINSKKDSVFTLAKSKEILDTTFISFKTNNKQVDSVVKTKLKNFETSKKSGNNAYKIKYNEKKQGLEVFIKTGKSEEKTTKKIADKKEDKQVVVEEKKETKKVKKRLPFWFWILVLAVGIIFYLKIK